MADLCVTIARRRHQKLFEEMDAAAEQGVRLMELRLDYLSREPRLREILKRRTCPMIATFRRREEGGQWRDSEAKRQRLLRTAIAEGFDYVDLELDVAERIHRFGTAKRIVSYHNMQEIPENLDDLYAKLKQRDADIVKIAALANHPADNFTMLRLLAKADKPTIAICMGELGLPSRILGAKFGSPFTYAAFNPLRVVAPGLPTFDELRELFRYESINATTEVYGVIGDPIQHSLSPVIHNACFQQLGLNKAYLPFQVPRECLDGFIHEMEAADVRGLSVTLPHKEAIVRYGNAADPLVRLTGSGNTLVRAAEGFAVYNTDGPAALSSLEDALPADPESGERSLRNKTVLILGSGGVARTIAFGLRQKDAIIAITSRNSEKAHKLAADVGCNVIEWSQRHARHFDVLINCTPLGMAPNVDASPFLPSGLQEHAVVFDTIYTPETTLLVKAATERDCIVVTGVEMFVRQAEAQFRLFAGADPPLGLMKTLVREELSPARKMLREVRLASEPQA